MITWLFNREHNNLDVIAFVICGHFLARALDAETINWLSVVLAVVVFAATAAAGVFYDALFEGED